MTRWRWWLAVLDGSSYAHGGFLRGTRLHLCGRTFVRVCDGLWRFQGGLLKQAMRAGGHALPDRSEAVPADIM